MKKIWLVKHPTHQFRENVLELAALHDLQIVDARFADQYLPEQLATNPPELTLAGAAPAPAIINTQSQPNTQAQTEAPAAGPDSAIVDGKEKAPAKRRSRKAQ